MNLASAAFGRGHAHGVAVAALKYGKVVYSRAAGMASMELAVPNTLDTRFRIASLTKQFLAYALLQLVEEGALDLDTDVRAMIPALRRYRARISLHHLLQNTSGLRDVFDLLVLRGQAIETPVSDSEIDVLIESQQDLNFVPGSLFVYSNTGFRLAAQLAEQVTAQPLETILRARIFGPLGMNATDLCRDGDAVLPGLATGYLGEGGSIRKARYGLSFNGDAGLVSSVNDLVAWERALPSLRILGSPLEAQLSQPARYANGTPGSYGLGTFSTTWRGLRVSGHGGLLPGFASKLLRFPTEGVSIVVLANSSHTDVVEIAFQVAETVLDKVPPRHPLPERLPAMAGRYVDRGRDELIDLVARDGRMVVSMHAMEFPLEALDDTRMRIKYSAIDRQLLLRDDGLSLLEGGAEHPLAVLPPYTTENADLARFEGEFHSPDLDTTYRFSRNAGRLMLAVSGPQGRAVYELERLDESLFVARSHPDYWLPYQLAIRFPGAEHSDVIEVTTGRTKSLRLSKCGPGTERQPAPMRKGDGLE